jgi:DNA transformation protein
VEEQLNLVGISTVKDLKKVGSKEAWLKIREIDESACINRLYALEGAIVGIRWHDLPVEVKMDLKDFYNFSNNI